MTITSADLDLRHPYRRPTDTEHHAVRGPLGQIVCYPTSSLREKAEKTWDSINAQHERVTCPVPPVGTRVAVAMEKGWAYHDDYADPATGHHGTAPLSAYGTVVSHDTGGRNSVMVLIDAISKAGPRECRLDTLTIVPELPDTPDTIAVTLSIKNVYVDHGTVVTIVETEVTAPPAAPAWENGDYFDGPADYANAMENHRDAYAEWEADQFLNHTGAGLDGDAGYFVTVVQSSDPDRLPAGTEIEFC